MDDKCDNKGKPVRATQDERAGSFFARKSLVIGLTGGVATGKTTVARMFQDLGANVISADEVVHQMLAPGSQVWEQVRQEFGREVLLPDGNIDRSRLADVVFRDPGRRMRLEAITHPPVLEYLRKQSDCFRESGEGVLVLEIPLLIETGALDIVDKVLVVTAEQESQISRLENRYSIRREEAIRRICSQLPLEEKVRHADWVISTEGTLESTKTQVERVWCDVQKLLA